METKQSMNYTIPGSIVIAGALIAVSLFFALSGRSSSPLAAGNTAGPEIVDTTDKVRPVDASDHIKGSQNPTVTIIEYSDFECPFCQRFHDTMNEIVETESDVAWVYRHFPLDQIHPLNARRAAVASECVAAIGGNDAFWKFTDGWFAVSPTNDQTDFDTVVPQLVKEAGVDQAKFDTCFASGAHDQRVQDDLDNAIATGGQGTPWSVVITASGNTLPLNGSQPTSAVRQVIQIARED